MKLDDISQGVRNSRTRWEEKDSKKTQGKRGAVRHLYAVMGKNGKGRREG